MLNTWGPKISPDGRWVTCGRGQCWLGEIRGQAIVWHLIAAPGNGGHWVGPDTVWFVDDNGNLFQFTTTDRTPRLIRQVTPGVFFAATFEQDTGAKHWLTVATHPSDDTKCIVTYDGIVIALGRRAACDASRVVIVGVDERTIVTWPDHKTFQAYSGTSEGVGELALWGQWGETVVYGGAGNPLRMWDPIGRDRSAQVNPFNVSGGEGSLCRMPHTGGPRWIATGYESAAGERYVGVHEAGLTTGYLLERPSDALAIGGDGRVELIVLSAARDQDFVVDRIDLRNAPTVDLTRRPNLPPAPKPTAIAPLPVFSFGPFKTATSLGCEVAQAVVGRYNCVHLGAAGEFDLANDPAWVATLTLAFDEAQQTGAQIILASDILDRPPLHPLVRKHWGRVLTVWCSLEGTPGYDKSDLGALDRECDRVGLVVSNLGLTPRPRVAYIDEADLASIGFDWRELLHAEWFCWQSYLKLPPVAWRDAQRHLRDLWARNLPILRATKPPGRNVVVAMMAYNLGGQYTDEESLGAIQETYAELLLEHADVCIGAWPFCWIGRPPRKGISQLAHVSAWHRHIRTAIAGPPTIAEPDIDEPPVDPPIDPPVDPPAGGDTMTLIEFFGLGAHYHTGVVNQIYAEVAEAFGQDLPDPGDPRKTVGNAGNAAQYIVHGAAYAARALKMADVQKETEAAPQAWHDGAAGVLLPSQEKLKNRVLAQMARDNDQLPRAWVDRDPQ